MSNTYKAKNMKACGVDDMILLPKIEVTEIVDNLEKRLKADLIYTYVGPVLVAVNPFKNLPYFTEKELDMYQNAAQYENPPHIYALCDEMYRNMVTDRDPQCCIISGESGAGKTVSAKYVMNYISKVSGGGSSVQRVKNIILQSNPLLEAFGNAKTIRNDNSSRFGKYVEILFENNVPTGGKISNFLLEKSRVITQNKNERNFHIFYQILCGATAQQKRDYQLGNPESFYYLSQSGCTTVNTVDDAKDYVEVLEAFKTIELDPSVAQSIIKIMCGILHLGNVQFCEQGNQAQPVSNGLFDAPARLLGIDANWLHKKLVSREMESKWGKTSEIIQLEHNLSQANFTRDALSKGIYGRIFTYLVQSVNKAISLEKYETSTGILDIYGFEIFGKNGFEQFCINYVNEKLQQIFIELTLKTEQEEYVKEGISWTPIKYFNNKVVCDLIESRRNPVGIMSILDDVCATMHAKSEGADNKLIDDLGRTVNCPAHFAAGSGNFTITHYAGRVTYSSENFCEKNRDVFFVDLIELMKSSTDPFLASLFPEDIAAEKSKGKPSTASQEIKVQANLLVEKLMKCTPHYIRCIKPNETKKAYDFEKDRVKHQVEYLGLKENIRVKRAGFAFRRPFDKFLMRFAICTPETFPKWRGDPISGCKHICESVGLESTEFQIGSTKLFIKKPESVFLLEEIRERKFDTYAVKIQKAWREYYSKVKIDKHREGALQIVINNKKRFHGSISRKFFGDYLGIDQRPSLRTYMERKEKVHFTDVIQYFGEKLRPQKVDFMVTQKFLYLVGREKVKKGPQKNQIVEVLLRKIEVSNLSGLTMSPFQDDLVMISANNQASVLISTPFKSELCYILSSNFRISSNQNLQVSFMDKFKYPCMKKKKVANLNIEFKEINAPNDAPKYKASGSKLLVNVRAGKPATSRPVTQERTHVSRSNNNASGQMNFPKGRPQQHNNNSANQNQQQNMLSQRQQNTGMNNQGWQNNQGANRVERNQPPSFQPPSRPAPAAPKYPTAVALWSYEATAPDEITIMENDIIEVIDEDPTGWWLGICRGKKGVFPGNYVEKK